MNYEKAKHEEGTDLIRKEIRDWLGQFKNAFLINQLIR